MTFPYRMNLSKIRIIQLVSGSAAELDDDFRQPRSNTLFSTVQLIIPAQVAMFSFRSSAPTRTGDSEPSAGHLAIKQRWLTKNSVTLQKGDKITGISTSRNVFRDVALRIHQLVPQGHLPHPGLLIARFAFDKEERDTP